MFICQSSVLTGTYFISLLITSLLSPITPMPTLSQKFGSHHQCLVIVIFVICVFVHVGGGNRWVDLVKVCGRTGQTYSFYLIAMKKDKNPHATYISDYLLFFALYIYIIRRGLLFFLVLIGCVTSFRPPLPSI